MIAVITSMPNAAYRVARPSTSNTGRTTSPTPDASAIHSGNGNGYSAPNQCSLYSSVNSAVAPKDRVNQPSHFVSPDFKNGSASVTRSTSSVSDCGHRPNRPEVRRASGGAKGKVIDDIV